MSDSVLGEPRERGESLLARGAASGVIRERGVGFDEGGAWAEGGGRAAAPMLCCSGVGSHGGFGRARRRRGAAACGGSALLSRAIEERMVRPRDGTSDEASRLRAALAVAFPLELQNPKKEKRLWRMKGVLGVPGETEKIE